jgi:hypothetical protein
MLELITSLNKIQKKDPAAFNDWKNSVFEKRELSINQRDMLLQYSDKYWTDLK